MKLLVFYFVGVKGDHISLYEITSLLILGGSAISSRLIVSKHQDQREASRLHVNAEPFAPAVLDDALRTFVVD